MNKIQETDYNTFLGVEQVVNDYASQLTNFPEILGVSALIADRKGKILANNTVQLNGTKDETGFKTSIRENLQEKFSTLVKAIEGSIANNAGLTAKYKSIAPSDLKSVRDGEVQAMINMVVADARSLGTALTRFGIDEALLTETETLASSYDDSSTQKRTVSGQRTIATSTLAELFDEVNEVLRKTDLVVKPLDKLLPDFFKAWFEARKKQGY